MTLFALRRPQHRVCSLETRPALQAWARAASQAPSPTWAETPLWVGNKHVCTLTPVLPLPLGRLYGPPSLAALLLCLKEVH